MSKKYLKCENCGEVFDMDDAIPRPAYVDNSGIPAWYEPLCPYCRCDELEDAEDPDAEEEENK